VLTQICRNGTTRDTTIKRGRNWNYLRLNVIAAPFDAFPASFRRKFPGYERPSRTTSRNEPLSGYLGAVKWCYLNKITLTLPTLYICMYVHLVTYYIYFFPSTKINFFAFYFAASKFDLIFRPLPRFLFSSNLFLQLISAKVANQIK